GSQGPQISCTTGAVLLDMVEPYDQTGEQAMIGIKGVQFKAWGTCTTDLGFIHLRGTANGTYITDVIGNSFPTSATQANIGILIDGPQNTAIVSGANPSNITSVSGNGSTVTVTLLPTKTNDPEATELSLGQTFVMSSCTGGSGSFNGTFTVATMSDGTSPNFTYAASGNGSPTGCTYTPTVVFNGTTGVMVFTNVSMNGGSTALQKPLVITDSSQVGGVQVTDLLWNGGNFQGADPAGGLNGGSGCAPNSSGTGANNPCWGDITLDGLTGANIQKITFNRVHLEAGGNSGTTGIYLRDTNNVTINGLSASSGGSDVVDISATTASKIWAIRIRDFDINNNWTNNIYNAANSRTYSNATYGAAMREYHYGIADSGSSNCNATNSAQTCDGMFFDNDNVFIGPDTHFNAISANGDFFGTVQITGSTTGTYNFAKAWVSAPSCFAFPMGDPATTGSPWATTSTSVLTVNVHTSGTLLVGYICKGNTN